MSKFDEITIGQVAELEHTISKEDISRFVQLTGDDNRLHLDAEYSARTSLKKPVAHGMLGASFISTVIGTKLPGDGALWFAQSLEFLLPVRVGDHLTVRAEVLNKDERSQVIDIRTDIFNQHRQKVTSGLAKVKIIEQRAELGVQQNVRSRTALVVGGTGGIGSAICRMLAKDGFDVAIHYFSNREGAEEISAEIVEMGRRSLVVAADIGIDSEVAAMVEQVGRRLGGIAVLVNCATATVAAVRFENLRWQDFEDHLRMTIRGSFSIIRDVVPMMAEQGYGKIIQIGSQAVETPTADWLPYITAKSALIGFSRALATELAPKGIMVNIVSPGMTDTDLLADIPERARLLAAARTPLRRLATPADVAGAVCFLASDRADFLTGETIRVNGGQVML